MDYLFETIVFYSQLVVYHGLAIPHVARSSYRSAVERNPPWLAQHPDTLRRYPPPRLAIRLSYALALLLAVAYPLGRLQTSVNTSLSVLFLSSTLAFGLHALLYHLVRIRPMVAQIPAPARRTATMQRRDLRDFVDPIWLWVAGLLNAAVVLVFLGGYLTGEIGAELLLQRTLGLGIGLAFSAGLLRYGLRRKPRPADARFRGTYRLREVQLYVAMFYLMAFVGLFRIGTDFLDVHLFTVLSYFVANSVIVQIFLCVLMGASWSAEQRARSADAVAGSAAATAHQGATSR